MLFPLFQYFKYLLSSIHLHGIHSPFVYQFNRDVIQSSDRYYIFDEIEALRAALILSDKKIQHYDLGAGGKSAGSSTKSISNIAKKSAKKPKHAELLFRIAKHAKAQKILELGTNLGISTAYLATATSNSNVVSIEGCPNLAKVAQLNFKKLKLTNVDLKIGSFDDLLPHVLKQYRLFDLIFIDGNHTEEATVRYFHQCLQHIHPDSIIIIDDINWSKGMHRAWNKIIAEPKVRLSINLFQMGILFFREGQEKEDFTIHH